MKKLFSFLIILSLVFVLSACFGSNSNKEKNQQKETNLEIYGVPETGRVLDITEINGQTATVTPGDILHLKLIGEANSGRQWSVISPTAGDYLMLKDHQVIGLDNSEILGGKFTDEWWLKVEKTGEFELQFDYSAVNKEPEDSFKFKVISQ